MRSGLAFPRSVLVIAAGILSGLPSAASALGFCVLHPLNPLCCPSPCPVVDPAKLAELASAVGQAALAVDRCRALAAASVDLAVAVGPGGPLAQTLRKPPAAVSAITVAAPGSVTAAGTADPQAVADLLKQALFEPVGMAAMPLTARLDRLRQRSRLAADQAPDALSSGLAATTGLGDRAQDRATGTTHAAEAADLRSDLAANGFARQSLLETLGGLTRLATEWSASQALAAAQIHPASLPVGSEATTMATAAETPDGPLQRLARFRQIRLTLNQLDGTLTALTALHNLRYAAQILQDQQSALQKTVDSHALAERFQAEEAARAGQLLGQLFTDGDAAFSVVAARLRDLDRTTWSDNGGKVQAAADAAQAVVQAMTANPAAFGPPRADGGVPAAVLGGDLANAFASWLEDDKLEAAWRPLGDSAGQAIGRLAGHLSDLSQRQGFDVTGDAAARQEQLLQDRLQQVIGQLAIFDGRDFSASQVTGIRGFVGAVQRTAADILGDPRAARAVAMAFPQ